MTKTLFFHIFTNNKQICSQYNICFTNININFFNLCSEIFWIMTNKVNQQRFSLCCSSPCFRVLLCTYYRPLQYFSKYFCITKEKEIGVLRSMFPDIVISCEKRLDDLKNFIISFLFISKLYK